MQFLTVFIWGILMEYCLGMGRHTQISPPGTARECHGGKYMWDRVSKPRRGIQQDLPTIKTGGCVGTLAQTVSYMGRYSYS